MPASKRPANRRHECHAAEETSAAINRAKALELKVMGKSDRAIAEILGVHHSTVQEYIERELADVRRASGNQREQLRDIERQRLEKLLDRWLPVATAETLDVSEDIETSQGVKHIEMDDFIAGTKAAELVVKISARLSALDGLDAPTKQEHSGTVSFENVSTIKARLAARAAGLN